MIRQVWFVLAKERMVPMNERARGVRRGMRARRWVGLLTSMAFVLACDETAPEGPGPEVATPVPVMEMDTPTDPESVRPFTIDVPNAVLDDLRMRLARTRWPDQLPGSGWDYGTERGYLQQLVAYWATEFDWRAHEEVINSFDHFKTVIDGVDVHFIHQRSPHEEAIPLLLVHGWPGSFTEFIDVIEPLTNPDLHGGQAADAFHVVVPSIPGFGFSGKPTEREYNPERMADILAGVMSRLGYERYGYQGGDWGAIIGRALSFKYEDRVIGLHSNFVTGGPPADMENPEDGIPPEELELRQARLAIRASGRGYSEIQGTKPQTVGYGLNDSPAGLAAWIVEKFHGWSDHDGDLESSFTKDQLLTNITVYWVTGTATSSARIYYESRNTPPSQPIGYVAVPTAAAVFPEEISFTPRKWAETNYNIVRWTRMPEGGHFAALEQPELLLNDIRAFFRELR